MQAVGCCGLLRAVAGCCGGTRSSEIKNITLILKLFLKSPAFG